MKKKKLLVALLEKVDKNFLLKNKYAEIRKRAFAEKPVVYALYDKKDKLYYVGCSSDFNARMKDHLKNPNSKHYNKWDKFSIYFTKTPDGASEVEAIALSLLSGHGWPKGNTQKPIIEEHQKKMKDWIYKEMTKIDEKKRKETFGGNQKFKLGGSAKKKTGQSPNKLRKRTDLKGLVKESTPLKKECKSGKYKGKTFHASLLPSGDIKCRNSSKNSPSGTAKDITGQEQNGLTFWSIQDISGKWIILKDFVDLQRKRKKRDERQIGS